MTAITSDVSLTRARVLQDSASLVRLKERARSSKRARVTHMISLAKVLIHMGLILCQSCDIYILITKRVERSVDYVNYCTSSTLV